MPTPPSRHQSSPQLVIASSVGRVACWALSTAAVAGCIDEGWHHGAVAALHLAGPMLLVSGVCWALWGWPRLVLQSDRVCVDNALRRTVVPWDGLDGTEVRWGLVLHAGGRTIQVPAAPLRSGLAIAARRQSPEQQQVKLDMARSIDRRVTMPMDAGTARAVIDERLERHRSDLASGLRTPGPGAVHSSWQWLHLAILALGMLGTAWVLLG